MASEESFNSVLSVNIERDHMVWSAEFLTEVIFCSRRAKKKLNKMIFLKKIL